MIKRRKTRKTRPFVEGLEERSLLSAAAVEPPVKVFAYRTPQGAHVTIRLFGAGTLAGTSVSPDGALNLEYNDTAIDTAIVGRVQGGNGQAYLASIHDPSIPIGDISGVGTHYIGTINLKNFNLIPGGDVNLTAGVGSLFLNSMASNSQIHASALPVALVEAAAEGVAVTSTTATIASTTTTTSAGSGAVTIGAGGATGTGFNPVGGGAGTNAGVGGLSGFVGLPGFNGIGGTISTGSTILSTATPTFQPATGFGGVTTAARAGSIGGTLPFGGVSSGPGAGGGTAARGGVGVSTVNVVSIPGTPSAGFGGFNTPSVGNVSYVATGAGINPAGTVGPSFGTSSATPVNGFKPAFGQEAMGVNIMVNHVNAQAQQFPAVGDPQIYGYDPTTNSLIRFDALTGNSTMMIPLSGFIPSSTAGVSLGRDAGSLVVLVGDATTIDAFNASTGAFVGGFSTADLASKGITSIDGLASTDVNTYVIDSTSNTTGTVVQIDLTKSLATGSAVAIGAPYSPKNHFFLSGAATGVPAKPVLYLGGTAAFISATPDQVQNGVLAATYQNGNLTEQTRGQLTQPASVAAPNPTSIPRALGSVEENLALDTGVQNGVNVVQLYSATSLAHIGTITLKDPNLLTDLSGSFHPELAGTALVDVQGNLRSFRSLKANGLVVNDNGFLNLVQINSLANSEVIGQPVGHTRIHMRNNVLILSADRVVGIRGGVFTVPNLLPVGPLTLPRD